jgi:hypothetical protein
MLNQFQADTSKYSGEFFDANQPRSLWPMSAPHAWLRRRNLGRAGLRISYETWRFPMFTAARINL